MRGAYSNLVQFAMLLPQQRVFRQEIAYRKDLLCHLRFCSQLVCRSALPSGE